MSVTRAEPCKHPFQFKYQNTLDRDYQPQTRRPHTACNLQANVKDRKHYIYRPVYSTKPDLLTDKSVITHLAANITTRNFVNVS
jgi:hypothetical protein